MRTWNGKEIKGHLCQQMTSGLGVRPVGYDIHRTTQANGWSGQILFQGIHGSVTVIALIEMGTDTVKTLRIHMSEMRVTTMEDEHIHQKPWAQPHPLKE